MDFDGKYYKVTVSTAKGNGGIVIYNIGQMKEEALPKIKGSYAGNGNDPRGNASIDSICSSGGNSQEKSGESALYQRRDDARTDRDVLSDAVDGDADCSAIWTEYKSSGCIAWMQPLLLTGGKSAGFSPKCLQSAACCVQGRPRDARRGESHARPYGGAAEDLGRCAGGRGEDEGCKRKHRRWRRRAGAGASSV